MPAGRPKKPVELRVYEGSYKEKKYGPLELYEDDEESVLSLAAPEGLSETTYQLYNVFIESLCAKRLVKQRDVTTLYLVAYQLEAIVKAKDAMATSSTKKELSLAIGSLTKAIQNFNTVAYKFGVSPVERTRLVTEKLNSMNAAATVAPAWQKAIDAKKNKQK